MHFLLCAFFSRPLPNVADHLEAVCIKLLQYFLCVIPAYYSIIEHCSDLCFFFFYNFLVLPSWSRAELFGPCLPALVRICEAFPPLVDDVVSLLMQLGRICMSEVSLSSRQDGSLQSPMTGGNSEITAADNHILCLKIQATFADILSKAVLKVKIY